MSRARVVTPKSVLVVLAAALAVLLTACSGGSSGPSLTDPYAKAAAAGEMTAIFGTIDNPTSKSIHVVKAHVDVAKQTQLHEMVTENGTMTMKEKTDGFTIAAKSTLDLKPGGLHIMLIGLTSALKAGDEVSVTLTLEDGSTIEAKAVVRDMSNAQESYSPSPSGHHG